ncbi:MAG: anaerobic ribonucleoside-triphosphate reductase activating protein [Methanomassiliicoccaceae archaeon]|jgi:pyruvate formate lyase activating enzyme|nr:anaerobic ribonucleoside-triphosphate reductase activating protein [Methanomassiliicoccaceae archaeon]
MRIAGFVKTTLQDWEGKNACMVLLAGCNFKCPYCNRPDLVSGPEEDIDPATILKYIKENKDFLEAVVISGGEPTMHSDLYKLITDLRKLKVKIKLDTNGYSPDLLDDLIGAKLVDKVCINIMAPLDPVLYSKAAGIDVDVERIRRSLKILDGSGITYEIRTVIVPGIINHESFVKLLKDLDGSKSMIIQQFDPRITLDPKMKITPYPKPVLVKMAETAKGYIERVRIRGF